MIDCVPFDTLKGLAHKAFFMYKPSPAFLLKGAVDEFRDIPSADIINLISEGQPESNRDSDLVYGKVVRDDVVPGRVIFDIRFVSAFPTDLVVPFGNSYSDHPGLLRFPVDWSPFLPSASDTNVEQGVHRVLLRNMISIINIVVCGRGLPEFENRILVRECQAIDKYTKEAVSPAAFTSYYGNTNPALVREIFIVLGSRQKICERIDDKDSIEYQLMDALDIAFRGEGTAEELDKIFERNGFQTNEQMKDVFKDVISIGEVAGKSGYDKEYARDYVEGFAWGSAKSVVSCIMTFMKKTGYSFDKCCDMLDVPVPYRPLILNAFNSEKKKTAEQAAGKDE